MTNPQREILVESKTLFHYSENGIMRWEIISKSSLVGKHGIMVGCDVTMGAGSDPGRGQQM